MIISYSMSWYEPGTSFLNWIPQSIKSVQIFMVHSLKLKMIGLMKILIIKRKEHTIQLQNSQVHICN